MQVGTIPEGDMMIFQDLAYPPFSGRMYVMTIPLDYFGMEMKALRILRDR